jgi:hypothetical protein
MKTPLSHALPWALLVTGMLAGSCAVAGTPGSERVVEFDITGMT